MAKDAKVLPKRILVALDGSRLAETVLPLVVTLARSLGAQVTLLHVLEYEAPATVHGEPHLTSAAEARAYLEEVARRLRQEGLEAETHVHTNPQHDVAASIAAHAAELDADMIVLAAHGRGGFREWLVGRIPQQVAARAGRPVVIVPAPTGRDLSLIRRVMLPIDPPGEARAAVPMAQQLALACHAEVVLVTIIPTPGTMPGNAGVAGIFLPRTTASLLDVAEDEARAKLEQLANDLRKTGLIVSIDVQRGEPAHELVQAVDDLAVDLVVMATHARAGLEGLWEESVAPRVVTRSPCPVLLVPIS